jgi:preprotein translocase subunit SecG
MWDVLWWLLLVMYVPVCIGLIVIVLLQKGKGTGFAGAFGIGAGSETVFGPQTSQGTPVKMTYIMASAFMVIALLMSIISGRVGVGAAPGLEDEAAMSDASTSGLEQYGLGTGVTGQIDTSTIPLEAPEDAAQPGAAVVETVIVDDAAAEEAVPDGPADGVAPEVQ